MMKGEMDENNRKRADRKITSYYRVFLNAIQPLTILSVLLQTSRPSEGHFKRPLNYLSYSQLRLSKSCSILFTLALNFLKLPFETLARRNF